MKKPMAIMIVALVIVFGGLFAFNTVRDFMIKKFIAAAEAPPVTISSSEAIAKTWQPYLTAIGSFVAVNGVDVNSEAAGIIESINFDSGDDVDEGELLVKLDDSVDQANLRDDEAQLELAQLTYERQRDLSTRHAASISEVDTARAQLRQAEAAVERTKALIEQKYITAPFKGKLGIRQVNLGEYVQPGLTTIVTLQSLDPLYLRFFLPEQFLKDLYIDQPVTLNVDGYPNKVFQGTVTAINSKVNEQTHNIEVQATVPNRKLRLYPGMYAEIKVLLDQQEDVVTVPHTAVDYGLYGDSIYLIVEDEEGKTDAEGNPILIAKRQFILVGDQRENEVAILKGVKPGDMVADSGQLKLDPGTRVVIDNSIKLERRKITGEEINDE